MSIDISERTAFPTTRKPTLYMSSAFSCEISYRSTRYHMPQDTGLNHNST